jgi:hypothetical protein
MQTRKRESSAKQTTQKKKREERSKEEERQVSLHNVNALHAAAIASTSFHSPFPRVTTYDSARTLVGSSQSSS